MSDIAAEMFARKAKSADVTTSLQRFADLHRDCASRAKHLKLTLDALCVQDKRQFIDDYSFETFHLVDELLLQGDLTQSGQAVQEAESALWTLEQLLCLAPELVGSGWQRNAIEFTLKKALFPHNMVGVRKIAIRLFLLWYQALAIYDNTTEQLDAVFQSLLPHFPLRSGFSTETILQNYCHAMGTVPAPGPMRSSPLNNNPNHVMPSPKIKAQLLQEYLDKFLEYCTRETTRLEWGDETKRSDCAKFILDRVIVLYMYETFPDIDSTGVDVYGGWEGTEERAVVRDTADPMVIARYWLIRWMTTIASSSDNDPSNGHALYKQALFSSRKATNTLLTLLKEAVLLPIPCSSVIHKVFALMRSWLLQRELAAFVVDGSVSQESLSLLVIHFLTAFFHSPYLASCGDRLSSAITLTQAFLQTARDLSNPSAQLKYPLSSRVWCELIKSMAEGVRVVTCRSDAYGRATSGALAQNLLVVFVFVRAIRGIEIEERIWDDVLSVFQSGVWVQMIEQWSRVVDRVTRALILNLFEIDIAPAANIQSPSTLNQRRERSEEMTKTNTANNTDDVDTGSVDIGSEDSRSDAGETSVDDDDAQINSVVQSAGDSTVWLRVWMRIVNLVSPLHVAHSQLAIQTVSRTICTLLRVSGTDSLVHWICARLLLLPTQAQVHCVPAFSAVLSSSNPPPLIQAHILNALTKALQSDQSSAVLETMPSMSHEHVAALAKPTLLALNQLVKQFNYSPRSIQVAALLAPDHNAAETLLLNLVASNSTDITLQSHALALNALALLVIERGDTILMMDVLARVRNVRGASRLLHLFCSDLTQLANLNESSSNKLVELLEKTLETVNEECWAGELLWQLVSLSLSSQRPRRQLVDRVISDQRSCLEGMLLSYSRQFPLTSFTLAQCNSIEYRTTNHNTTTGTNTNMNASTDQLTTRHVFVDNTSAILSVDAEDGLRVTSRTAIGKHCWRLSQQRGAARRPTNVTNWLRKLSAKPKTQQVIRQSASKTPMTDPFQGLPQLPRTLESLPIECSDMYSFIQQNRRVVLVDKLSDTQRQQGDDDTDKSQTLSDNCCSSQWRELVADLRLINGTRQMPNNFARDLRHLDQTTSRELHKVAVIYVAKGQEEKNVILANGAGSESFERFVSGLGWQVQAGKRHLGYSGGLSGDTIAPYYASADSELIFHVSTMLGGDVTQKLKHLGNDEVHVVWSEHDRPYRRDTIATRFCDVLLVLYQISTLLVRVRVETQRPLEFGPLFDGAHVHVNQLPHLVRDTVLNASRAYRIAQQDCARPLQHRERVFEETRKHLVALSTAPSISHVYVPSLKS